MKILFQYSLIILLMCTGCSDDKIINNSATQLEDDTTILRTDKFGTVLGGDSTDWCSNTPAGTIRLNAAYPNPNHSNSPTRVNFELPTAIHVKLFFRKTISDTLFLINEVREPGYYQIAFYGDYFGFHQQCKRLYMKAGDFYCYGDVRFE